MKAEVRMQMVESRSNVRRAARGSSCSRDDQICCLGNLLIGRQCACSNHLPISEMAPRAFPRANQSGGKPLALQTLPRVSGHFSKARQRLECACLSTAVATKAGPAAEAHYSLRAGKLPVLPGEAVYES